MEILELPKDTSITEEQHNVLKRIRRNIERSDGEYALYFVECNLPNLRQQLINELDNTDNLNLLSLDIADYSKDEGLHIDEWVSIEKAKYQYENPEQLLNGINIIGLERLLPTDSDEQIIQTVSELNWRRSYFQALSVPIIFWLPSYALALLANQASDFYDWYSDIYYFKSNLEQRKIDYSHQALSLYHPESNIPAHAYQSKQQKEKQIRQLNALLHETSNMNDIGYIKNQMGLLLFTMRNLEKALLYFCEAYGIFRRLNYKLETARTLNNISQVYIKQGKSSLALSNLQEALDIINESSDETILGATLNGMGEVYDILDDKIKALYYYEKALKICTKTNDKPGISATLNNIASIYHAQSDYISALKYFEKSLAVSEEIDNKLGAITALANVGSVYEIFKDYDNALFNFYQSLRISEEISDEIGIGTALHNIANVYQLQGNYVKASEYFRKSVSIFEYLDDKRALAYSHYNLGLILKEVNSELHHIEANEYIKKAYLLAKEINLKDIISDYSTRKTKPQ